MAKDKMDKKIKKKDVFKHSKDNAGGAVYGLGVIGSAIYFISTSTGFWMGLLGILKAFIWPVFLTYGLFKFLGM